MNNRLNFIRPFVVLILAFVSIQYTSIAFGKKSNSTKVEQNSKEDIPLATLVKSHESEKGESEKSPELIGLTEAANSHFDKGEYDKVTELLWKNIDKLDRQAIMLLSKAHDKKKEYPEMIRALNMLVGKNEKDFEALTRLGSAFGAQKKNKDALDNFKKAIEVNPKYEPAYLGVAEFYEKRNPPNYYELRILYQDMIDNIGTKAMYLEKLCEVNSKDEGTIEFAIDACRKATVKDSKSASSFVNLGTSLKLSGKTEEGESILKKAAKDFPQAEVAQYSYAKLLDEHKNSVEAMKYYKAATEADAKSARSWLGLAVTSFEIRKYDVAFIAYKNACKYEKKNAVAFRKATTSLRNQKVSEWIDKYESASEICNL